MTARPGPWRAALFDGRRVLVAGAGAALGPVIEDRLRALGADAEWAGEIGGADAQAADALVERSWQQGPLLALVALATDVVEPASDAGFDAAAWRAGIDRTLNAAWYLMHAAAKRWKDADLPGQVVCVIPAYREPLQRGPLARAAGSAIAHLVKTVAVEWAAHRIRVNCIALAKGQADAGAVADALTWLCAPSGKFVTGEVVHLGAVAHGRLQVPA